MATRAGDPNVRAASYFLALTTRGCWRCEGATTVFGFVLRRAMKRSTSPTFPADDCWEVSEEPTVLSYVTDLTESVATRLRRDAPQFYVDFSQTIQSYYWMNHCERCGAKLGDEYTFSAYGGAFKPLTQGAAAPITLKTIRELFSAHCNSYTCGVLWFSDAEVK